MNFPPNKSASFYDYPVPHPVMTWSANFSRKCEIIFFFFYDAKWRLGREIKVALLQFVLGRWNAAGRQAVGFLLANNGLHQIYPYHVCAFDFLKERSHSSWATVVTPFVSPVAHTWFASVITTFSCWMQTSHSYRSTGMSRGVVHSQIGCTDFKSSIWPAAFQRPKTNWRKFYSLVFLDFFGFFRFFRIF